MKFDHLGLCDDHRQLIRSVSPSDATSVFLLPLDKGLSGASVWLSQWITKTKVRTSPSVLKIGEEIKIKREYAAYEKLVRNLHSDVGPFTAKFKGNEGILRQPFRGRKDLTVKNLAHFLADISTRADAEEIIQKIIVEHMEHWHPDAKGRRRRRKKIGGVLDWWRSRYDLLGTASGLGQTGISDELKHRFGTTIEDIDNFVKECFDAQIDMVFGPIHGDLHAQNILVDPDKTIHLIDFAWSSENWKIIDFVMLECSLKFLVAPINARQKDLMSLEELIDFGVPDDHCEKHHGNIYGTELMVITAAINKLRLLCGNFGYIESTDDYLRALICLTACLASKPGLNRRFLINSLAYNMLKLKPIK